MARKKKQKVGRRMVLQLPWPPSVNDYYGRNGRGGVYLKPEARRFRRIAGMVIAYLSENWGPLPIRGPVRIKLIAHPPDRRRYDLDNREKALFDALEAAKVIENDAQVVSKTADKAEPVTGGAYVVLIEELVE